MLSHSNINFTFKELRQIVWSKIANPPYHLTMGLSLRSVDNLDLSRLVKLRRRLLTFEGSFFLLRRQLSSPHFEKCVITSLCDALTHVAVLSSFPTLGSALSYHTASSCSLHVSSVFPSLSQTQDNERQNRK